MPPTVHARAVRHEHHARRTRYSSCTRPLSNARLPTRSSRMSAPIMPKRGTPSPRSRRLDRDRHVGDEPGGEERLDHAAAVDVEGRTVAMPLAKTAVFLLREHRTCPHEYSKYVLHLLLDRLCRHAEPQRMFVSEAAQRKADRLGLGKLSEYTWYQQTTKMGDKGRKTFHWDHFVTIKELRRALLNLDRPTEEQVREILRRASVAWILKSEDRKLNQLGFRADRPNPHAAYRKADIRPIRAW